MDESDGLGGFTGKREGGESPGQLPAAYRNSVALPFRLVRFAGKQDASGDRGAQTRASSSSPLTF